MGTQCYQSHTLLKEDDQSHHMLQSRGDRPTPPPPGLTVLQAAVNTMFQKQMKPIPTLRARANTSSMQFSGFRSRWHNPQPCIWLTALSSCAKYLAAKASGTFFPGQWFMNSKRSGPLINSHCDRAVIRQQSSQFRSSTHCSSGAATVLRKAAPVDPRYQCKADRKLGCQEVATQLQCPFSCCSGPHTLLQAFFFQVLHTI